MTRTAALVSLLLAVLVGLAAVQPGVVGAAAQPASPVAGAAVGLPAVPDPTECTVAPRSLESVGAALGTVPAGEEPPAPPPIEPPAGPPPAAVPAEPEEPEEPSREPAPLDPELGGPPPVPVGIELPEGEPVDAATVAAVTASVRRFVACANAGDVGRMYALVSDEFLRQSVGNLPLTAAVVDYLSATPVPRPAESRTTLFAVREVRRLPDGRVGALVDDRDPTDPRGASLTTDFVVFVEADGSLLLDEYVSGLEAVYDPVATPTP